MEGAKSTKNEGWRRPPRRRVMAIRDRLRQMYGCPQQREHRAPLDELILTVLSQNTNDRNRDIAFSRLRERLPTWEDVHRAPVSEVEEAIRPGGISKVKSVRIKQILDQVADGPGKQGDGQALNLDWLEDAPRLEARKFLQSMPGVGRKTAACVLLFSFGIPEVPVDTHVYRTSARLGLIRDGESFDEAHETMLSIINPDDAYETHMNLLRHGRRVCKPKPRCERCGLKRMCPYLLSRRENN